MHEKHKEEIRTTVICRYLSGISVKELSHQQGVPRSTIYHWIQKHNEQINSAKKKKVNLQNFKLLENKVTRLEGIILIIKAAGCAMDAPLQKNSTQSKKCESRIVYTCYVKHMTSQEALFIIIYFAASVTTCGM